MNDNIFLGNPSEHIREWIMSHSDDGGGGGDTVVKYSWDSKLVSYHITGDLAYEYIPYLTAVTEMSVGTAVTCVMSLDSAISMEHILIPSSVSSIESNAFNGQCSCLTSISCYGHPSIGISAFYNCYSLVEMHMPAFTADEIRANADQWGIGIDEYSDHEVSVYCSDNVVVIHPEIPQDDFNTYVKYKQGTDGENIYGYGWHDIGYLTSVTELTSNDYWMYSNDIQAMSFGNLPQIESDFYLPNVVSLQRLIYHANKIDSQAALRYYNITEIIALNLECATFDEEFINNTELGIDSNGNPFQVSISCLDGNVLVNEDLESQTYVKFASNSSGETSYGYGWHKINSCYLVKDIKESKYEGYVVDIAELWLGSTVPLNSYDLYNYLQYVTSITYYGQSINNAAFSNMQQLDTIMLPYFSVANIEENAEYWGIGDTGNMVTVYCSDGVVIINSDSGSSGSGSGSSGSGS